MEPFLRLSVLSPADPPPPKSTTSTLIFALVHTVTSPRLYSACYTEDLSVQPSTCSQLAKLRILL
eukprot:scaffold94511_cov25-Tisochrysis_lutea.AAC.2